jgi:hypothetical protein
MLEARDDDGIIGTPGEDDEQTRKPATRHPGGRATAPLSPAAEGIAQADPG